MNWSEMAVVGRIARAHGIRGQMIVDPETDFPDERFQPGAEVFIERNGAAEPLRITTLRFHRQRPIIGVDGVVTMTDAETFAGRELRIPVERLAALPSETFYWHDLIGCDVSTVDGAPVGPVTGVEGSIGRSRLIVGGPRGEVLIPMVSPICKSIDVQSKRIVIDAPDGLLDLNAKGS